MSAKILKFPARGKKAPPDRDKEDRELLEAIINREVEFDYADVAKAMGITVAQVRAAEASAFRKLRPLLRKLWWEVSNG